MPEQRAVPHLSPQQRVVPALTGKIAVKQYIIVKESQMLCRETLSDDPFERYAAARKAREGRVE